MTGILIGYAPCSTEKQDVEAQRQVLLGLGVAGERIYLDRRLTRYQSTPAGTRSGARRRALRRHTLLVARGVSCHWADTIYKPSDPTGKMFFNILATSTEFEVDLLRKLGVGQEIVT